MKEELIRSFAAVVIVATIIIAGCGEGGMEGNANPNNPLANTIPVAVSAGNQPVYSWTGGNVKELDITTGTSTVKIWGVSCPAHDNCIASPVTHGTAPANTTVTGSATILNFGQNYTVTVISTTGATGTSTFTP